MNQILSPPRLKCLRCAILMDYLGQKKFQDVTGRVVKTETFDVYACPQCGKSEFFVPQVARRNWKHQQAANLPLPLEVAEPETAVIPSHIDLLKIHPGETTFAEVYETLGKPMDFHFYEDGVALCYPSRRENASHVVFVDTGNGLVRYLAVYNHMGIFTLEGLEKTYDVRESAGVIDGHEHWFFEGEGVAFIAEGRNDYDVLYVQFFERDVSLEAYQRMEGYSRETFICDG